jgi:hypothetical protein
VTHLYIPPTGVTITRQQARTNIATSSRQAARTSSEEKETVPKVKLLIDVLSGMSSKKKAANYLRKPRQ